MQVREHPKGRVARWGGSWYFCSVENLKDEGLEITYRMDSGYFDDAIQETIESLGGKYVIKGKGYPTLVAQVTDPSITFITGESERETTEFVTALNTWEKDRRFVVSR